MAKPDMPSIHRSADCVQTLTGNMVDYYTGGRGHGYYRTHGSAAEQVIASLCKSLQLAIIMDQPEGEGLAGDVL